MRDHLPRQETIIATEECAFILVGRSAYVKILDRTIEWQNKKMNQFLRQIPFMSEWLSKDLTAFAQHLKINHYSEG